MCEQPEMVGEIGLDEFLWPLAGWTYEELPPIFELGGALDGPLNDLSLPSLIATMDEPIDDRFYRDGIDLRWACIAQPGDKI